MEIACRGTFHEQEVIHRGKLFFQLPTVEGEGRRELEERPFTLFVGQGKMHISSRRVAVTLHNVISNSDECSVSIYGLLLLSVYYPYRYAVLSLFV